MQRRSSGSEPIYLKYSTTVLITVCRYVPDMISLSVCLSCDVSGSLFLVNFFIMFVSCSENLCRKTCSVTGKKTAPHRHEQEKQIALQMAELQFDFLKRMAVVLLW
jgi:hypothetical protein